MSLATVVKLLDGAKARQAERRMLVETCCENGGNDFSYSTIRRSAESFGSRGSEVEEDGRPRRLSQLRLLCLTISMGGLQTIWTSIMSQGSPYLASLGLSPALISLVWLSGPISGMFIQPCIGVFSDSCTHPWGRRKSFIIFGTIATSIFMTALPWTADLVQFLCMNLGANPNGRGALVSTQFLAAMWIWALKISLQPVQCGIRALIVDCCPEDQQLQASAYASRVIGVGSIFGYATGFVDLPLLFPFLGNTQFKALCAVCCMVLSSTIILQYLVIHEKKFEGCYTSHEEKMGILGPFKQVVQTIHTMPKKIKTICIIQFFAWVGWFPFLYYITTFIGYLYRQDSQNSSPSSATRYGTISMLCFATTAFITSLALPYFITTPSTTEAASLLLISAPGKKSLTLSGAWLTAHALTSLSFLLLGFTRSRTISSLLIAILGTSWAVTQWVPFALIGCEISKSRTPHLQKRPLLSSSPIRSRSLSYEKFSSSTKEDTQTALILGLHNLAISAPQIVAAIGSSILFWILGRIGVTGVDAMGWLFMLGCLPAAMAAFWCWDLSDD